MNTYDTLSVHEQVMGGLSFSSFERLLGLMDLPLRSAAELLRIPPRTLHRRKLAGRLDPDESDRVVRMSRIFGKALELFEGDRDAAMQWLESPVQALGGERPLEMSRTEPGALEVERVIGRLEHGVIG